MHNHYRQNRAIALSAVILSTLVFSLSALAQSSTVSPYSQFGLGHIQDVESGYTNGMDGLGIALRKGNQVNPANPASYSGIDSLTFIFDAGVSGQITNFTQGAKKLNASTASIDYLIGSFRVLKNVGVSFGLLPYSNVGYNYSESQTIGSQNNLKMTNTYSAPEGGLQEFFVGVGVQPVKGLSLGVNAAYLGGDITRNVVNTYSDSYVDTYQKQYNASFGSYKLDFGAQVYFPVSKKDVVTLGLTYGLGHKLGANQELQYIHTNAIATKNDTVTYSAKNAFAIPHTFGVGASWSHDNRWTVGVDYSLQKWSNVKYPVFQETANHSGLGFIMMDNYYKDRQRLTVGGEFCANENSRKFFDRVRYRFGASYASSYYDIKVKKSDANVVSIDGPREISLSGGFAIPLAARANCSFLNVSAQWVNAEAKGFIKENTFRLSIGLTFNERWFEKWKLN